MAINKDKKEESMSAEEIQAWEDKDKYKRKIEKVTVKDDASGTKASFFIVAPDRETNNKLSDYRDAKTSVGKIQDLLINSCTLAGDLEVLEWCDPIYYGLIKLITEKLEAAKKV